MRASKPKRANGQNVLLSSSSGSLRSPPSPHGEGLGVWALDGASNIQIHHILRIFLDELLARLDGLAHEDGEDLVGGDGVI